jgi:O-antigen/teichoic acid export membrane protein
LKNLKKIIDIRVISKIIKISFGQIFLAITALIIIRVATELMTKNEFGIAMMLMGVSALLDSIISMTFNQTLLYKCGKFNDSEDREKISIALTIIIIKKILVLSLVLIPTIILFIKILEIELYWLIIPILLTLNQLSEVLKNSKLCLLLLQKKHGNYSLLMILDSIYLLIGIFLILKFYRHDALGYFFGYIFSKIAFTFTLLIFISKNHFKHINFKISKIDYIESYKYGKPISIMGPIGWLTNYLDRYLLGIFLGPQVVGTYVAATSVVNRPYGLATNVLTNYFRPILFSNNLQASKCVECKKIVHKWIFNTFIFGSVVTLGFYWTGDIIGELFLAKNFRENITLLMTVFSISQLLNIATHAVDNALFSLGKSSQLLKLQILSSILGIVFSLTGVLTNGIIGCILGKCFAELFKFLFTYILFNLEIRNKYFFKFFR